MDFHRRHGRLPGATQPPGGTLTSTPASTQPAPRRDAPTGSDKQTNPKLVLAILMLLLVGLWIAALLASDENASPLGTRPITKAPETTRPDRPLLSQAIKLGASAQLVRTILGEPVSGWEQRWEYGPSWIAFHCGVVVDWYSSPLRPLKVASEHPAASTGWSPPQELQGLIVPMPSTVKALLQKIKRRTWMKYALRGVGPNDNFERLELAYSDRGSVEHGFTGRDCAFRRQPTASLNASSVTCESLLEIGCGEGHQIALFRPGGHSRSMAWTSAKKPLYGRACALPGGQFAAADLFSQPWRRVDASIRTRHCL